MLKVVVLQRLQSTFTLQCLLYRLLLFLLAAATQKKMHFRFKYSLGASIVVIHAVFATV